MKYFMSREEEAKHNLIQENIRRFQEVTARIRQCQDRLMKIGYENCFVSTRIKMSDPSVHVDDHDINEWRHPNKVMRPVFFKRPIAMHGSPIDMKWWDSEIASMEAAVRDAESMSKIGGVLDYCT